MRILVVGAYGQAGQAVHIAFARDNEVIICNRSNYDITDSAISNYVSDVRPDIVVNCAAWTNVDGAEANPDMAYAVNMVGPRNLADGCRRCGADLVQLSTNEVFDGESGVFYREYDTPNPKSVYARSKLAGERAVSQIMTNYYIVRVAWLFGKGNNNFPSKIIAAARKHGKLQVVDDEFGNPTYTDDVANAIVSLVNTKRYGIYHLVNSGYASRYELAQHILQEASLGHIEIVPISSNEWIRETSPPPHAVLLSPSSTSLGIQLRSWQEAIFEYMCAYHQ